MRLLYLGLLLSFSTVSFCSAQSCKTDAPVISSIEEYLQAIKADPGKKLVELKKVVPGLLIDMRYATANNFTKTVLYHNAFACLCEPQAFALKQVQEELNKKGLALKIYDAFRPFSVTCRIWKLVPDRRYAANPRKGSNHNRGIAVDVTLIDLKTGKELDMGTAFDNFTDTAHHNFYQLSPDILANRRLLKAVMRKYGFSHVPTEWWHYHWRAREGYPVINLDFDELAAIIK